MVSFSLRQTNSMASNVLDFVDNISDTEDGVPDLDQESDCDEEDAVSAHQQRQKRKKGIVGGSFMKDFTFSVQNEEGDSLSLPDPVKRVQTSSLDSKIARVRQERKRGKVEDGLVKEVEECESEDENKAMSADVVKLKEKKGKKSKLDKQKEQEKEKQAFAETVDSYDAGLTFSDMNIARPLMKGLSAMQFEKPTPIQAACIPVAMKGKDVCACAVTGSGKTVAFVLPILERLLYRSATVRATRVLILVPTRELAVQVYQVGSQLCQYTSLNICLAAGGLEIKSQEAALRLLPDIVVATPGRLIDHLHNTPNFSLNSVEILVLDEADRMLDEYFADQMTEIIKMCNFERQTMLFSATMSEAVQDLAAVSLKDPVKVFVNQNTDVALGLQQQFIRIRENREGDREAIVSALVSRSFCDKCIVFLQTKVQAHRMHIVLGLLGINCGELHGNLSQQQRLEALEKFKEGEIDVLLATDLASRGLDIEGVKTVINFTMPATLKHYVHRVGRTARAGNSGRAVSLVGETERAIFKEVLKHAKTSLKHRKVPPEVVARYHERIVEMNEDIETIMREEQEERKMRAVENQANKAQRLLEQGGQTDRKRDWFQTHKERMDHKKSMRLDQSGKKQKDGLTTEERVKNDLVKAQLSRKREHKKDSQSKRMRSCQDEDEESGPPRKKAKKEKKKKKKERYDSEDEDTINDKLTRTDKQSVNKMRAKTSQFQNQNRSKHKMGRPNGKPSGKPNGKLGGKPNGKAGGKRDKGRRKRK